MKKGNKVVCSKCGEEVTVPNEIKRQIEQAQKDIQYNLTFQLEQKIIENTIKQHTINELKTILENKEKEIQEITKFKILLEKIEREKVELELKTKLENEQILKITKNVEDLARQLEGQKQVINDLKKNNTEKIETLVLGE